MQIQLPYDNATEIKKQHDSMGVWHKSMAESHTRASAWHESQSDMLYKALNEVPLDPDKTTTSLGGAGGVTTGEPSSATPPAQNVPIDPVKKSEFIQILLDHSELFKGFGMPIEQIAETILGI
jgi:hypothetical protein